MFETWNSMSAMLQTSEPLREAVASVISDRFPAREWRAAFDVAASAGAGKVILDWTEV
jgi:threonine 3-dehydrogenase